MEVTYVWEFCAFATLGAQETRCLVDNAANTPVTGPLIQILGIYT